MKKVVIVFSLILFSLASAKKTKEKGYIFTDVNILPHTQVKNQFKSGTCWCFSGVSFLEAEIMRKGKPAENLSEMYIVRQTYSEKATQYVRFYGKINFSQGGAFHDVTAMSKEYGLLPQSVYSGYPYGEQKPNHGEVSGILTNVVKTVTGKPNGTISPVWHDAFDAVLDVYFGKTPTSFQYKGKNYTSQTFMTDYCEINPDDYVEITSFTHHPFYQSFILEVSDNWMQDKVYNVPMGEFMQIIDNSLVKKYPVAWAADVSGKGFDRKKGIAVVPLLDTARLMGTCEAYTPFENISTTVKSEMMYDFSQPVQEERITQELRQTAFDNQDLTDDHGMLIVGTAKDQNGSPFYKVINSWGDYNKYHGYLYASKAYLQLYTMDIMVHKDAIPLEIRRKLRL